LESWHGFYQRIRSTLIGLSQNVGESSTISPFVFVNTKKLHVFDFLLILYVLPDLSSLGFIEPLDVIDTVAQILLQFGPWNMANKVSLYIQRL
jgi:hypothetical protein